MATYRIRRIQSNLVVVSVEEFVKVQIPADAFPGLTSVDTTEHEQEQEYPLVDMTGEGFEYGYVGNGPGNLALSILAHFLGELNMSRKEVESGVFLSKKLHKRYRNEVIALMDRDVLTYFIRSTDVASWLAKRFGHIDLAYYKKMREDYRLNNQIYDTLETDLTEKMYEMSHEEFNQKREAWKRASLGIVHYEEWLYTVTKVD